jgi:hypothetical protein
LTFDFIFPRSNLVPRAFFENAAKAKGPGTGWLSKPRIVVLNKLTIKLNMRNENPRWPPT